MGTAQMRLRVLAGIMLVGLLVLTGRLWMLQLTRWMAYAQAAASNRTSVAYEPAPRGMILDRAAVVLAENRPVWNVSVMPAAYPRDAEERERILGRLASILQAPLPGLRQDVERALAARVAEACPLTEYGTDVPLRIVAQVEEQGLELPGIVVTESFMRRYPHTNLGGHVLGYARAITEDQYKTIADLDYPDPTAAPGELSSRTVNRDPIYASDAVYGQTGLEREYEINLGLSPPLPILTGRRGRTVYEVDAAGRRVRQIEERPPAAGATVYLTIDARVQQAAQEALRSAVRGHANRTAAAVVVEVTTGDIVALASYPDLDPNEMVGRLKPERYRALTQDARKVFLNKAVAGEYPPASTFKMISATAALETGRVKPGRRFYCTGSIREGPNRFECWKPQGHGSLDLRYAIAESCDVYFYESVRQAGLTADDIRHYANMFGFGEKSGLDIPEERPGFVPDPAWKRERYRERWWTGDSLVMVIGQGATTSTPLQVAMATAAVANGGELLQPRLVRKIDWPKHMRLSPTVVTRSVRRRLEVKPETLEVVHDGMRLAVTAKNGTGGGMSGLPVTVAGKTGSAEHIPNRPTHAWFTCLAPSDHPRYVVTVFVSEGGHGSSSAVPAARKILGALFGFASAELPATAPVSAD